MAKPKNDEQNAETPVVEEKKNVPAVPGQPKTGSAVQSYDYGQDTGAGTENVTGDEFQIPFLRILQALSPQCRPVAAGGLAGAKPGMIFNAGTGEMFDGEKGIPFLPVHRDHNFVEFYPRPPEGPGGFVGLHAPDAPKIVQLRAKHGKFGKLPSEDDKGDTTEIGEAYYLYGLVGLAMPAMVLVPFASTQIKKYKNFMARIIGIKYEGPDGKPVSPPLWAHRWNLTTVYETKGTNNFYGWSLTMAGDTAAEARLATNDPLYVQGREFYNLIKTGQAKADYAKAAASAEQGEEEIPM
jgi:hypothetical protein